MSEDPKYDWASAVVAIVSTPSSDFVELAKAAQLDPLGGDFSDADFSGLDLSNQNLSGWDLRNAKFTKARLTNTVLRDARVNPNEIIEGLNWEEAKLDEQVLAAAREAASKRLEVLDRPVKSLEFSVRTENILRNAEIQHIGDLVQKSEAVMLKMPNGGRKSLNEMKEVLGSLGLRLGMELDNWVPPRTTSS